MRTRDRVFRALADPTRRAVFESLREGARSVGDVAEGLPVSRPAVSQHLKALKIAGLVRETHRGTHHFYEIDPEGLEPLRRFLEEFWGDVITAFERHVARKQGGQDGS